MVVEIGRVVEMKDGKTVVMVSRNAACSTCPSRSACNAVSGGSRARIVVDNRIDAAVDDVVEIGVGEGRLLAASFIVYILPVAALFIGAGLGTWVAGMFGISSSGISAFMGLVFLAAGIVAIRLMDPYLKKKDRARPRIIRIVEEHR